MLSVAQFLYHCLPLMATLTSLSIISQLIQDIRCTIGRAEMVVTWLVPVLKLFQPHSTGSVAEKKTAALLCRFPPPPPQGVYGRHGKRYAGTSQGTSSAFSIASQARP